MDFVKTFDLLIGNSSFVKKEEGLATIQSAVTKTQIDYLLLSNCDKGVFTDCKVIPSENLMNQHRLVVIDVEIKRKRNKKLCMVNQRSSGES